MTEKREAKTLMQWARYVPILDELLLHIANERHCSAFQGYELKLQGVKAGVSDYFLPLPRGQFHGMWLELKTTTGRLQPLQDYWLAKMRTTGYSGQVAYGAIDAIDKIKGYLNLGDFHVRDNRLDAGVCNRCACCKAMAKISR